MILYFVHFDTYFCLSDCFEMRVQYNGWTKAKKNQANDG
jgi:hypothetical protein